jgi:LPXTG-motif cell wall-anchored protein
MKFLRVLANALLSGLFFSTLLSLLFADLNINQKISLSFLSELSLHLTLFYGLLASLFCVLGFFAIQFFIGKKARIPVLSLSFLLLTFPLLTFLFLLLLRVNYGYFSSFFEARVRSLIQIQMLTLSGLALLGLAVFIFYRRKKRPLIFWAYFLLLALGLVFAFSQRWRYPLPQPASKLSPLLGKRVEKRITIIGLEGLSFDFMIPLISEGKLPNFSWLMDQGSSGRLVNFSPTEQVTLNASFNSGKFPAKHRQLSLFRYRLGKMVDELEIVPRFFLFKQLVRIGFLKITPSRPVSQARDIWQIFEGNNIAYVKRDWPYVLENPRPDPTSEKLLANLFDNPALSKDSYFLLARNAFLRDSLYENLAADEKIRFQPQIFYLLIDGLDTVQTYFYKYSFPQQFGSIDQDLLDRYGPVIKKYYEFYDELIGKYLTGLKEDELLVVFSPHGTEPLPLWKRLIERLLGNPSVSAYHEFAPDGAIFFYGKGVVRGQNMEAMQIVDVAPTLLYYLGLPVGRDMDGIVRSPLFSRDFISENPIIYIPSYEECLILPPP